MKLSKLAFLALALAALPAQAQSTRGGKSEFYIAPGMTSGENYTFEGGSNAKTDTGYSLTLGYAFNFDQHKSLGIEFGWGSQDYRATVIGDNGTRRADVTGSLDTWTVRFLGTYNFMEGNFTPFVTGGLGWTYLDTNVPTGLPQNVCWYYPWYAYCTAYVPTATTTKFSYNAGAGLRLDSGKGVFRFLVSEQWMDFGGGYGSGSVTQYRIDFGTKF
jgi:hypothetical protein